MPRDLFSLAYKDDGTLTASSESQTCSSDQDGYIEFTIYHDSGSPSDGQANEKGLSDLHPYMQTLSSKDVGSCVALEMVTFPEHERCSREKVAQSFNYRFY